MKKIWLASIISALNWTGVGAISAQAAIVTYDFQVDLTKGTLLQNYFENEELDPNCPGGIAYYCPIPANETTLGPLFGVVGEGFFTFDDAAEPTGFGAIPLTSLFFNFEGTSFTLADDDFFTPGFIDNLFGFGIDFDSFTVSGNGPPPGSFVTPSLRKFQIQGNAFDYDFADIAGTFDFRCQACVTYTLRQDTPTSIPEPTSIVSLLTLSILGMGSIVYRSYGR